MGSRSLQRVVLTRSAEPPRDMVVSGLDEFGGGAPADVLGSTVRDPGSQEVR